MGDLLVGWAIVLISTFLINHFELFGLRQVYARLRGRTLPRAGLQDAVALQAGAPPDLPRLPDRLLGDAGHDRRPPAVRRRTTGYILIGIQLEERDLIPLFGTSTGATASTCRCWRRCPGTPRRRSRPSLPR